MNAPGSIWQVQDWPSGWTVRHVEETGSTNSDLLAALEAGSVGDRTALVADHQTAGRGRLDRRWEAPPGANLLVTFGFTNTPMRPSSLTQRIGVAAVDAIRQLVPGCDVRLKWPNDVLLDGVKLAGILAQRSVSTDEVVVGLGLNIAWAPPGAAMVGGTFSPATVLAAVLGCFDTLPVDPSERYRAELATIGRDVRVELPGEATLLGRAVDVDPDGRLLVSDIDQMVHRFDVGDVIHLR